jgi:hypothetical protein
MVIVLVIPVERSLGKIRPSVDHMSTSAQAVSYLDSHRPLFIHRSDVQSSPAG